ncbi:MAG: hypothetical protein ACUVRD_04740 [Bacteroidia bacterium]
MYRFLFLWLSWERARGLGVVWMVLFWLPILVGIGIYAQRNPLTPTYAKFLWTSLYWLVGLMMVLQKFLSFSPEMWNRMFCHFRGESFGVGLWAVLFVEVSASGWLSYVVAEKLWGSRIPLSVGVVWSMGANLVLWVGLAIWIGVKSTAPFAVGVILSLPVGLPTYFLGMEANTTALWSMTGIGVFLGWGLIPLLWRL